MCNNRKQLYGAIEASRTIDQGPLFKSENINSASLDAQTEYAKLMNKFADKQARAKVNIGKYNDTGTVREMVSKGVNLGRTPEALLPKKVYGKIDKKMSQWDAIYKRDFAPKLAKIEAKYDKLEQQAGKDAAKLKALDVKRQAELDPIRKEAGKVYRDGVGKQFKQAREQLQAVYDEHAGNPKRLQAQLKKMGLTQGDAYYTEQYLGYLENGGPYFDFRPPSGNRAADWISERVSTITGKKVSFNLLTSALNVAEIATKGPATFGFKHTANGILDAQKAARAEKVTIFDRIPSLEKKGVYSTDLSPLRPGGKNDPLTRTQNLLDNAAYFIGKSGGDIQKGLKEIAYRPKPWNDTFLYQDPRAKTLIPFMSFQFRHFQQYGGWLKAVAKGAGPERRQAARALAVYSMMNGLIFGDKAAIPAPVYLLLKAADPKFDDHLKELTGDFLTKGIVGSTTGIDLSKYNQPLGGVQIGIGTDMLQGIMDLPEKTLPKVGKQLREGRVDKAALLTVAALVTISQAHKSGANAAVQKAVDAVTKAYIEDEDLEGAWKILKQKFFGKDSVTAEKKAKGNGLPTLPSLPKLPSLP